MDNSAITDLIPETIGMIRNYKQVMSKNYFNESSVFEYDLNIGGNQIKIPFYFDDIIATTALINEPVAIVGSTGGGKSYLAEIMSHCLFGNDIGEKTINSSFDLTDFLDPNFKELRNSENKSNYLRPDPILEKSCLTLNELNRTPTKLQNLLFGIFEKKEIEVNGKKFKIGTEFNNGHQYLFVITTLNEGKEYVGVSETDKALRDRISIELHITNYKHKNRNPVRDMIKYLSIKKDANLINQQVGYANVIKKINSGLADIPLDVDSILFLSYLALLDKCVVSNNLSKLDLEASVLNEMCKGCQYKMEDKELCPNVYSPSERAYNIAKNFGRAAAFMRTVKTIEYCAQEDITIPKLDIEVTLDDMIAIAPLIFSSKTTMNQRWLNGNYQGNREYAIKDIGNLIVKNMREAREVLENVDKDDPISIAKVTNFKKKRFSKELLDAFKEFLVDE